MGVVALTLIAASLVYLCLYPPEWMRSFLRKWTYDSPTIASGPNRTQKPQEDPTIGPGGIDDVGISKADNGIGRRDGALAPPMIAVEPAFESTAESMSDEEDGQTTPKATAEATFPDAEADDATQSTIQPTTPANLAKHNGKTSHLMPPPPLPQLRIPSLKPMPNQSTLPASAGQRNLPIPNRRPSAQAPSTSTLAPPPSISSKPTPPRRPVTLTAGHSPLDWARLSSDPTQNLSGLPPGVAYLRIAPSQLKSQNGRKGKDAWMVLGGLVYNVTPYLPFHPGGVPELMRGAGRNGTKLFGEIHPWVNYEGMLSSCLVGRLVEEGQGFGQEMQPENEMDQVD
jgi:cytochrome b involved in lipid metabolism